MPDNEQTIVSDTEQTPNTRPAQGLNYEQSAIDEIKPQINYAIEKINNPQDKLTANDFRELCYKLRSLLVQAKLLNKLPEHEIKDQVSDIFVDVISALCKRADTYREGSYDYQTYYSYAEVAKDLVKQPIRVGYTECLSASVQKILTENINAKLEEKGFSDVMSVYSAETVFNEKQTSRKCMIM